MKNLKNIYLAVVALLIISSCQQQPKLAYTHSEKEYSVTCNSQDVTLFKEALYSFEDDIINYYNKTGKDITRSYRSFVNEAIYDRAQIKDMVSQHTIDVFNALKLKSGLWNGKTLNYNNELVKCIGENISNKDLKTTFNALVSTNSMNPKLFGAPLRSQSRNLVKDKYLATFVSLDLFYSKLFDIDFEKVKAERKQKEEDDKKAKENTKEVPADTEPHAGHDHKAGEQHF